MSNVTPILMLTSLKSEVGGLHQAIYMRARALAVSFPRIVVLVTDYSQHFERECKLAQAAGHLPPSVEIVNIYNWFMQRVLPAREIGDGDGKATVIRADYRDRDHSQGPVFRYLDKKNSRHNGYRCFENGVYTRYEGYLGDRLDFVDYFSPAWIREEKHLYNRDGHVDCVLHLDPSINKPKLARYFNLKNECVLSVRVSATDGTRGPVYLHADDAQFDNHWEFVAYWVNQILGDIENPVLFIDKRELITYLASANYKKVYVLHSNHLQAPYVGTRKIVPSLKPMVSNENHIDRIVVPTPNQRGNLIEIFGISERKIVAIPHCQEPISSLVPMEKRDGNKVVTVARYHPVKALHEAIHAFHEVVRAVPDATYDIYGYGPLRGELQQTINALGLQESVFLRGFSASYVECFSSAKVSVLTSQNEGFGMVVAESMACGTPVVSYDTNFGPRFLIRDGVDGYLIPMGNREVLAERIKELLLDDEERQRFSRSALEITDRLSEENYIDQWKTLVENLDS